MAQRATSLGLKPSLFVLLLFFFFCLFLSFVLIEKPWISPKKGPFFDFQCFPFSLPSLFLGLSFFHVHVLCLSLSLSLFFFLPSFLSFFFAFFLFLIFVSFFLCLSSLLCFMKRTTSKYSITKIFVHQSFLIFVAFLSSFSFKSPFLIFACFLIFSFVFCSTSMFSFKKCKFKKHQFWVKRGVAT